MHIIISEPGNYCYQFEFNCNPTLGKRFRIRIDESPTQTDLYEIMEVDSPPLGLSGVFSYQVKLQKAEPREHEDAPFVPIEKYNI